MRRQSDRNLLECELFKMLIQRHLLLFGKIKTGWILDTRVKSVSDFELQGSFLSYF